MRNNRIFDSVMTPFFALLLSLMLLLLVCTLTSPRIERKISEERGLSMAEVLPEGENFTPVEGTEFSEGITGLYYAQNGAGYVISSIHKGSSGTVEVMTGIDSDGSVKLIKVCDAGRGFPSEEGAISYSELYKRASEMHFGAESRARSLYSELSDTGCSAADVMSAVTLAIIQYEKLGGEF